MFRHRKAPTEPALKRYQTTMLNLLRQKQRRVGNGDPELDPRPIPLSAKARKKWIEFYDECERDLAPGRRLESIRPFASKLAEHALRIAGVLTLIDDANAKEVSADAIDRAIALARYYADETLRLHERGTYSAEIERAEKLLRWLHEKGKTLVAPGQICQYGPNAIREVRLAREALKVLEEYHWVVRLPEGAKIDGKRYRDAWEVIPPT